MSQSNFKIQHQYRDFFSDVQRNWTRIGDVGEESDAFKDRAFKQFHETDYHKLAEIQDEFVAQDPTAGTPGREMNRNYNRMEYDTVERHDGKDNDSTKAEVNGKIEMTVDNILKAFQNQGWTLNSTASTVSSTPIQQSDYKDQIKL